MNTIHENLILHKELTEEERKKNLQYDISVRNAQTSSEKRLRTCPIFVHPATTV